MCWTMWVTLMLRGQSDKAMRVAEDVTDGYKSICTFTTNFPAVAFYFFNAMVLVGSTCLIFVLVFHLLSPPLIIFVLRRDALNKLILALDKSTRLHVFEVQMKNA